MITSINRRGTLDLTFDQTMNLFKTAQRPMRVEFARSSDLRVQLDARRAPLGLRLGLVSTDASEPGEDAVVGPTVRCVVMGFDQRVGAAESSGVVIPGPHARTPASVLPGHGPTSYPAHTRSHALHRGRPRAASGGRHGSG